MKFFSAQVIPTVRKWQELLSLQVKTKCSICSLAGIAAIFSRALFPAEFSVNAESVFRVVKWSKSAGTQNATLLHVQDERELRRLSPEQQAEYENHAKEQLDKLRRTLMMFEFQPHVMIKHGIPFRETLKVADEIGQNYLIVIETQGSSAARELLSGSTFENVIRLGRHPVLAIRTNEESA